MSTPWKSIIKSSSTKTPGPKKRLSFAITTEEGDATAEQGSEVSQSGLSFATANSSCRSTRLGFCYNPRNPHTGTNQHHNTVPMKESDRNNVAAVLSSAVSASGCTINVVIVGETFLGEKFKACLLELNDKHHSGQRFKWKTDLNITCEKTLTPVKTSTAHYIIFLFMMETHQSMRNLSEIVKSFSNDTLPCKRILVITVSSKQGYYKNVTDLEQFHNLLETYNLIHFPWKEKGRLEWLMVKRILGFIYKSVGYGNGVSLLMDYLMQLNINWCDHDIEGKA